MRRLKSTICILFGIFCCGYLFSQETPEWLKRVELSFQYESDKKPTFYFQTVQPIYQSLDKIDTFFYQPRISLRGGDLTYSVGVGYRKLLSENLLLGANIFGDYQDLHEHGRVGVGFEAIGQILEARLNGYFGVTTKRIVEDTLTSITYEKVADGLDFEIGSSIPYIPWLKLYTSGFWYDFDKFQDKYGWKTRLEAKISKALSLEFYTWDDNKGEQEYGGKVQVNLAFDRLRDFKDVFKLAKEPFPKKNLEEKLLMPVERNFDIVVEKWSESKTGNVTVEIGRAN